MHIHDAKAQKSDHLTLGTGELDINRYLKLSERQNCSVVLETKTVAGMTESVIWLNKRMEA